MYSVCVCVRARACVCREKDTEKESKPRYIKTSNQKKNS